MLSPAHLAISKAFKHFKPNKQNKCSSSSVYVLTLICANFKTTPSSRSSPHIVSNQTIVPNQTIVTKWAYHAANCPDRPVFTPTVDRKSRVGGNITICRFMKLSRVPFLTVSTSAAAEALPTYCARWPAEGLGRSGSSRNTTGVNLFVHVGRRTREDKLALSLLGALADVSQMELDR